MRILKILVLISLVSISTSCSFFSSAEIPEELPEVKFVDSGKVIKPDRLIAGGKLLIVPFTAGKKVEATDQLDKVALKIVKGVHDIVNEKGGTFEVLVADNADTADTVLKGHIVETKVPATGMKGWIKRGKKKVLAVEGKMVDKDSKEVILYFSHKQETKDGKVTLEELGLFLGMDIGKFIMSGK